MLNYNFYVHPLKKIDNILYLGENTVLKVIKPLYSILEASNYWFSMYYYYYTEKLYITELTFDPCLLYSHDIGFRVVSLQTNNTLFLGDHAFAATEEAKLKEANFIAKEREKLIPMTLIKFNGGQIKLKDDSAIVLT